MAVLCPDCGEPTLSLPGIRGIEQCSGCLSRVVDPAADRMTLVRVDDPDPGSGPVVHLDAEFRRRYVLRSLLGGGGAGLVFRALQVATRRAVAIKILRRIEDQTQQVRFLREARTLARIRHPNVVQVFDSGTLIDVATRDPAPYIVMELVEGPDLLQRLRDGRPMAPEEALPIAIACLGALAACHDEGILHRDLKPANILLAASGEPRLTDFGLAINPAVDVALTRTGILVGTPAYLSPERIQKRGDTPAGDLYSMGLILYEMLTGRYPFTRGSYQEILAQHLCADAPSLRSEVPAVPAELDSLVRRCLAKNPDDRPASARALAMELENLLGCSPDGPGSTVELPLLSPGNPLTRRERVEPPSPAPASRPEVELRLDPGMAPEDRCLVGSTPENSSPTRGFEILEPLGRGATGEVFRARQIDLDRAVALKLLHPHLDESQLLRRFFREAELASQVEHPHVVRIMDAGRAAGPTGLVPGSILRTDDPTGRPFIAMELVEGVSIKKLVESARRRAGRLAGTILREALQGLDALHRIGMIHRDVKPDNIMWSRDGRTIVMDLGAAKDLAADRTQLTRPGAAVGTPAYFAPEVLAGEPATAAADIWALGCVHFFLITGRPLFQAPDLPSLVGFIMLAPLPDLEQACPSLSPGERRVLGQMLERDRSRRFPDARGVLGALEQIPLARKPGAPWGGPARTRSDRADRSEVEPQPSTPSPHARPRVGRSFVRTASIVLSLLGLALVTLVRTPEALPEPSPQGRQSPGAPGAPPGSPDSRRQLRRSLFRLRPTAFLDRICPSWVKNTESPDPAAIHATLTEARVQLESAIGRAGLREALGALASGPAPEAAGLGEELDLYAELSALRYLERLLRGHRLPVELSIDPGFSLRHRPLPRPPRAPGRGLAVPMCDRPEMYRREGVSYRNLESVIDDPIVLWIPGSGAPRMDDFVMVGPTRNPETYRHPRILSLPPMTPGERLVLAVTFRNFSVSERVSFRFRAPGRETWAPAIHFDGTDGPQEQTLHHEVRPELLDGPREMEITFHTCLRMDLHGSVKVKLIVFEYLSGPVPDLESR